MKIFICGNSRSGTTMMSRILGNNPAVFSFQELHFFDELLPASNSQRIATSEQAIKLYTTLSAIQHNGYFGSRELRDFLPEATAALNSTVGVNFMDVYEKFLVNKSREFNKTIPCEQTPQNIFAIDEILHHFSDARIIIMYRDPREVLLSQKNKWKRRKLSGGSIPLREAIRSRINYHPVTISKIWHAVMQKARNYSNNEKVLMLKYEDLILNPVAVIQKICNHCEISFDEKMLNIPVVGSSNFEDQKSATGIDTTRARQWENGGLNTTEIHICQSINQQTMQAFNYELKDVKPSKPLLIWYYISMPIRLGMAALLNLKRLKHIKNLVKQNQ